MNVTNSFYRPKTAICVHRVVNYLKKMNIKPLTMTAYNSTGNDIVKLVNQEIRKGSRILQSLSLRTAINKIQHLINYLYAS